MGPERSGRRPGNWGCTGERCGRRWVAPCRRNARFRNASGPMLLNAMNAMPNGGTVDIFAEQTDSHVLVRVTDTGAGISQEDLDKIFDPFFTKAPLGKGTGLGLSICNSIVDQHGGSISVESQSGKGSTFTVKLPRSL